MFEIHFKLQYSTTENFIVIDMHYLHIRDSNYCTLRPSNFSEKKSLLIHQNNRTNNSLFFFYSSRRCLPVPVLPVRPLLWWPPRGMPPRPVQVSAWARGRGHRCIQEKEIWMGGGEAIKVINALDGSFPYSLFRSKLYKFNPVFFFFSQSPSFESFLAAQGSCQMCHRVLLGDVRVGKGEGIHLPGEI